MREFLLSMIVMKKQLVYVCQSFLEGNGWGRLARCMTEQALGAGYQVYTSSADGTGVEGAMRGPAAFDVHASIVTKVWRTFWWRVWLYRKTRGGEMAIHVFSEPQFWMIVGLAHTTSVGTLCGTYVDPAQHGDFFSRRCFQRSLNQFHYLVAISEYTRLRVGGEWRDKVSVIPLGVSASLVSRPWKKIEWNQESGYKVLSVGAVKPRKGFLELIRGFHRFTQRHPEKNSVLAIVGDLGQGRTEYVDLLKSTIRDLDLVDQVILVGKVEDEELYGWYRWCDVFALTAIDDGGSFEGFGLVYLEANLFDKPCLGVASSGASQAIDPRSGVAIPSAQEDQICEGFTRLLDTSSQLTPLVWAKEHSWDRVFALYKGFYD